MKDLCLNMEIKNKISSATHINAQTVKGGIVFDLFNPQHFLSSNSEADSFLIKNLYDFFPFVFFLNLCKIVP